MDSFYLFLQNLSPGDGPALQPIGAGLGAVAKEMFNQMSTLDPESGEFNPIFMMADSGARGSREQVRQLAAVEDVEGDRLSLEIPDEVAVDEIDRDVDGRGRKDLPCRYPGHGAPVGQVDDRRPRCLGKGRGGDHVFVFDTSNSLDIQIGLRQHTGE